MLNYNTSSESDLDSSVPRWPLGHCTGDSKVLSEEELQSCDWLVTSARLGAAGRRAAVGRSEPDRPVQDRAEDSRELCRAAGRK